MYQAIIHYTTEEDIYSSGCTGKIGTDWTDKLEAATPEELRSIVEDNVYSKREDWGDDQINDYEDATEYWADYLANADNMGEATPTEIENWKQGKQRLWLVSCHILVSQITKQAATL